MKKLMASVGLLAVLAGACSGGGGSSFPDLGNNATDTAGTAAAPTSVAEQSNSAPAVANANLDVPSDFPMPVPDWAQIDSVQNFESTGVPNYVIQISMDASKAQETADAIRAFYEDHGLTIDDSGSFIMAQNSEVFSTVTIIEAGVHTTMILSWAPA